MQLASQQQRQQQQQQQQHQQHQPARTIFHIQELGSVVGSYLTPPQLLSCVQVSSLWHSVFSPSLWHTIDDNLYSWKHYLEKHDSEEEVETGGHDTRWVMDIFAKYGNHIRELTISWKVLISAAFEGGACTELVSLRIHALFYETKREKLEKRGIPVGRSYAVKPGPFLSPIFEGGAVLKETWSNGRSERQQRIDWLIVQQYWLLLRQNLGLRSLDLRRMPQWMGGLAQEAFFYETVGMLDRLVDVAMDDFEVDLNVLFNAQPKLLRFRTFLNLNNRHTLTTLFSGLRLVECKGYMSPLSMATLLERLPGLEEIRLYSFLPERLSLPATTLSAQVEELKAFIDSASSSPSNLQTFFLERTKQGAAAKILEVFLPWWPNLKRLSVTGLTREIALTAIKSCPVLEHVSESKDPTSIFPDHQTQTDHNIPTLLLKSCPQLRVINGIKLTIDVRSDPHAAKGWVCPQLTTLRCQIIGLPRLTEQERNALDTQNLTSLSLSLPASFEDNLGFTGEEEEPEATESRTKIQTFQRLHHQIYDQLAQLTNLRRLVLGFEFRDFHRLFLYSQGLNLVWNYDDPVPGTLEFSLASGLGRLSTLKNLEEFGFEGLNHRIGRLEIEWMAVNWPRLRLLRGVSDDKTSGRAYAMQKQLLREHMQSLRPDIAFE